jgi:hypothetical protein
MDPQAKNAVCLRVLRFRVPYNLGSVSVLEEPSLFGMVDVLSSCLERKMQNKAPKTPANSIRPDMEIITADGKRAGYVVGVIWGEIIAREPQRRIPLSCLRRVAEGDVYIAQRLRELDQAHPPRRH